MAEERTTEEERNHIMEARRRVANKRKKVKLTVGSKSTETDDDDDEGLIKNVKFLLMQSVISSHTFFDYYHLQKPSCQIQESALVMSPSECFFSLYLDCS